LPSRVLHRAQIERQLALGLGGGHLDHSAVFQDVFVDLGPDPVQRITDQTQPLIGVEALDRLHQTDVALLDQVTVRQVTTHEFKLTSMIIWLNIHK
jgi:hypothetical protein